MFYVLFGYVVAICFYRYHIEICKAKPYSAGFNEKRLRHFDVLSNTWPGG